MPVFKIMGIKERSLLTTPRVAGRLQKLSMN